MYVYGALLSWMKCRPLDVESGSKRGTCNIPPEFPATLLEMRIVGGVAAKKGKGKQKGYECLCDATMQRMCVLACVWLCLLVGCVRFCVVPSVRGSFLNLLTCRGAIACAQRPGMFTPQRH